MGMETRYLYEVNEEAQEGMTGEASSPMLFISIGKEILSFALSGRQVVGRPSAYEVPDIVVPDQYVSRRHGVFETDGDGIRYTADKTTNRTIFRGKPLAEGETVTLLDGDELMIPTGDGTGAGNVLMVVASTEMRLDIWQKLMEESKDSRTGLGGRLSFESWYASFVYGRASEGCCLFLMQVDFYAHLLETKGRAAVDKAVVLVQSAVTDLVPVQGGIFQWSQDTFAGVLFASERTAAHLLETVSEHISGTLLEESFRVTVSTAYMDLAQVPEVSEKRAEELVGMLDRLLEDAKEQDLRNCLVKWKA